VDNFLWIGINITTEGCKPNYPQVISHSDGSFTTIWQNYSGFQTDIYGLRYSDLTLINSDDVTTTIGNYETIDWKMNGIYGDSLKYKVDVSGPSGSYLARDWTEFSFNQILNFPIDRDEIGQFNYTILFQDDIFFGNYSDTVIVTVNRSLFGLSGEIKDYIILVLIGAVSLLAVWSLTLRKKLKKIDEKLSAITEDLPKNRRKPKKLESDNQKNINKTKSKSKKKKGK
jgi:hypothetical protein